MGDSTVNFPASEINSTWFGWPLTVTDRATGETITDRLGDFWVDDERGHVWLYMVNAGQVELRVDDTITHDGLGLMGGAA